MRPFSPTRAFVGGLSRRGTSKNRIVCNSAFLKNLHRLSVVQIVQTSHLFCTSNFVLKINYRQISVRASAPCENSRKPFPKPKSTALPRTIPVSEQSVGTHGGSGSNFAGQAPCHVTVAPQGTRGWGRGSRWYGRQPVALRPTQKPGYFPRTFRFTLPSFPRRRSNAKRTGRASHQRCT